MTNPRRIVLLSDGTGNSASAVWRTNVWRMFASLDLTSDDQIACYDDGVGTSSFKPLAMLGGAFGFGLKRNVLALYKFACRNFRADGDEIYGFGFSRGAFTIRVVIGLIIDQGLVPASNITEHELDRRAIDAYKRYRSRHFHTNWVLPFISHEAPAPAIAPGNHVPVIKFLGLWDTVAAYGLPIDEMTQGVSQWILPLEIPRHTLHPSVQRVCHALALDDERTTFHPVLWDESEQALTANGDLTKNSRISQVWFAGVHSNVGGGYPDDSLAYIPMYWIMQEARTAGLTFKTSDPDATAEVHEAQDKDGRLYDSRSGLGCYYRYGPRRLSQLCSQIFSRITKDKVEVARPKIHESVFKRIANHAHPYAPIGIPHDYQVVRAKQTGSTPADFEIIDLSVSTGSQLETASQARARVVAERAEVWPWIYVRGLLYLITLATTLFFVMFPYTGRSQPLNELTTRIHWVSETLRAAAGVVPGWAVGWLKGYAQYPGTFILVGGLLVVLILMSGRLEQYISDNMTGIWRQSLNGALPVPLIAPTLHPTNFRYRLNRVLTEGWKTYLGPALSAIAIIYVCLTVTDRLIFTAVDQAGYVCTDATKPQLLPQEGMLFTFDASNQCFTTGYRVGRLNSYYVWTSPDLNALKARFPNYKTIESTCQPSPVISVDGIASDARGFSTFNNFEDQNLSFLQTVKYLLLTPLRRYWTEAWLQPVLRYGSTGEEVDLLYPDPDRRVKQISENVVAPISSQIFFYLNQAVLSPFQSAQPFYNDTKGCVSIFIKPKEANG
jgi:uncharacterized protein (DUF2235 family)